MARLWPASGGCCNRETSINRRHHRLENGHTLSRDLTPDLVSIADIKALGRATRKHPAHQVRKLATSLERFGFVLPILIDSDGRLVDGWGLVLAAQQLGVEAVPAITVSDLPEAELRSLRLALNRMTEDAVWNPEALALEFSDILELAPQLELDVTGFEMGEIDILLDGDGANEEDDLPVATDKMAPVTRVGDLWVLGDHRLHCGDALKVESYSRVLGTDKADMMFTDPPYNVPIDGHVTGLGRVKHREFALASGEMDAPAFTEFLRQSLAAAASGLRDGAIAYVCMDWRHMRELLEAGHAVFDELKNLCVWNKTNGGMGSFYRSKHELVFVFKKGGAAHINNFGLGDSGRHRTNVWDYPGISSLGAARAEELAMHPTVKPVALIADAIRDCSKRDDLVLDVFGGSGSTLIAADQCGRVARLIELDQLYCDTIIRRFQRVTEEEARLAASDMSFAEAKAHRLAEPRDNQMAATETVGRPEGGGALRPADATAPWARSASAKLSRRGAR